MFKIHKLHWVLQTLNSETVESDDPDDKLLLSQVGLRITEVGDRLLRTPAPKGVRNTYEFILNI